MNGRKMFPFEGNRKWGSDSDLTWHYIFFSRLFQDRPGSPPRSLASILRSDSLSEGFRSYLRDLDEEEDDDVTTRVYWLDFVLACREVRELQVRTTINNSEKVASGWVSLAFCEKFPKRETLISELYVSLLLSK